MKRSAPITLFALSLALAASSLLRFSIIVGLLRGLSALSTSLTIT
jgi:hypothetical protein